MAISAKTLEKVKWVCMERWYTGLFGMGGLSIGVDLGSQLNKFVVLKQKGDHYILKDWGIEPVTSPLHSEAFPTAQTSSYRLTTWLKKGLQASSLGISVSGPRVIVKRLEFPSITEEDIREHLRWELDRYISLEMGEVLWDIHVPPSSSFDTSQSIQVLLVGAQKEWLESIISHFKEWKISFVDVDAFALTNLITEIYGPEKPCLLAHIGPSGMLLLVMHHGEVVLYREVPFAEEWYGDLVDQIRVTQVSSLSEKPMEVSAQMLWEPFLEEVTGHIRSILSECSATGSSPAIGDVVLSGGYAVIEGMAMGFSQRLGLPVKVVDPFQMIEVPAFFRQDSDFLAAVPLLGVAAGVAIRGNT